MNKELVNTYDDAVSYILQIPRFSAKNTIEDTKAFLSIVGEDKNATVVHVAGTNGKGSVCAFMQKVHEMMGKKTGLFTSPHLVDIRERIIVDGEMISKEAFLDSFKYVAECIDKYNEDGKCYHPSFFEFIFFMAVYYFSCCKVEVAIYETGLGGRLDATNSLSKKDICVITEIGYDHMEYLGDTIDLIANEKAGIIMEGVPVVFIDEKDIATKVIKDRAESLHCEYKVTNKNDICVKCIKNKNIDFSYKYRYYNDTIFTVHTYAHYQVYNAALAIDALLMLYSEEELSIEILKEGIKNMTWAGRMEEIDTNIIVDGCHNVDGVSMFIESVREDGCKGKRVLIFTAVSDKQIDVMSDMITSSNLFDEIVITTLDSSRASSLEDLKDMFAGGIKKADSKATLKIYDNVKEAYEVIKPRVGKEDRLYICGSLYLVGELKGYVGSE